MNPTSKVSIIQRPSMSGMRASFVLGEDRVGHYPEFRDFFSRTFELERKGLSECGYLQAASGAPYELVFLGRSGQPYPSGVEINALVPSLEPIDEACVDSDLWSILSWMVEGVGGKWTVDDLQATGMLYRLPAALASSKA